MNRIMVALIVAVSTPAQAQQTHEHATATVDGVKALSPEQIGQYLGGEGMGLARAAELNHYPGPKHVLELADSLGLSADQVTHVRAIRERVATRARELGATIVEKERELDMAFAMSHADANAVERLAAEIGRLNGVLRGAHLIAHIETRTLLSFEQVQRYDRLRRN